MPATAASVVIVVVIVVFEVSNWDYYWLFITIHMDMSLNALFCFVHVSFSSGVAPVRR